jgi:hypothetical protein
MATTKQHDLAYEDSVGGVENRVSATLPGNHRNRNPPAWCATHLFLILGYILLLSYLFQTHRPVHKKMCHSKPSHLLQRWVISLVQNSEPCQLQQSTVHLKHFMLLSSPLNHRIAINVDTCITTQAFLPLFFSHSAFQTTKRLLCRKSISCMVQGFTHFHRSR